jgi:hypothetical protein
LKALLEVLIHSNEFKSRREADCNTRFSPNGIEDNGGMENFACNSVTIGAPFKSDQYFFS